MTYKEALRRGVATFVAGATASPLTAVAFDVPFLKAAGIAGLISVWNFVGRSVQASRTPAKKTTTTKAK